MINLAIVLKETENTLLGASIEQAIQKSGQVSVYRQWAFPSKQRFRTVQTKDERSFQYGRRAGPLAWKLGFRINR